MALKVGCSDRDRGEREMAAAPVQKVGGVTPMRPALTASSGLLQPLPNQDAAQYPYSAPSGIQIPTPSPRCFTIMLFGARHRGALVIGPRHVDTRGRTKSPKSRGRASKIARIAGLQLVD